MNRLAQQLLLAACAMALAGCVERVDSDGAPVVSAAGAGPQWELAGEWGGDAEPVDNAEDPWDQRFRPGGFKQIAGLCATAAEVWVCDLGISRIQVFGLDGSFRRSIGAGIPLEGTLPTLEEIFDESVAVDFDADQRWELTHGEEWRVRRFELFRIADVAVTDSGYWAADWTKTSDRRDAYRDFSVYFKPEQGDSESIHLSGQSYPEYLAYSGTDIAISSPTTNGALTAYRQNGQWQPTNLNSGIPYARLMLLNETQQENADYMGMFRRMSNSGRDAGEFYIASGVAFAFKKLLVCDMGNRRLQIFNVDRERPESQGELARVIHGRDNHGRLRFGAPLDIDVDDAGTMFVLDSERLEVAVLDTGFNRIGSFGSGKLLEPAAIDLSDDGRHCFVSDRRENKVFHYVRAD